jgi:hypothetical protein
MGESGCKFWLALPNASLYYIGDMSVATIDTNDYLTCVQAAKALGLSPESVRAYCNNESKGATPALKGMHVGRDWIIHKSEIARYKKERNSRGRPSSD